MGGMMKTYFVGFNFNVGTGAGTSGSNQEYVYDVPDDLIGQALTDYLKKSLEAAGAPRVVRDIKIIG
jgi:hypothetical protein